MVANAYCASNTIIDSLYSAVGFTTGTNNTFQYNTIIHPGQDGIMAGGGSLGTGVMGIAIINSNSVTGLNPGRVAFTNAAAGYAVVFPLAAANYNAMSGVVIEPCAEGGQDISGIESGDWSAYTNINLTGMNTFVARVAGAGPGGAIEVHLDGPAGTLIGTCPVSGTGGWQTYLNMYGNLSGAGGTHAVYLVYTGGAGSLFNLQFFGFYAASPVTSHQLIVGNTYALKSLANGKYVTAPNGGTNSLIAQSTAVGTSEQFQVVDAGGGNIGLLALVNTQYVCAENNGASPLIANRLAVGSWETFTEFDAGGGNIGLRAMNNGRYVTAPNGGNDALIAQSTTIGTPESFLPVFVSGVPPSVPANLRATAGNTRTSLNWISSASATGYNVRRSTASGGPYAVIATNVAVTSYTDSGLTNGTTYYYVVSAVNLAGESANSVQVYAMPGALDRTIWVASSSTAGNDLPGNALDGNLTTRWSTGTSQVNGQWFQVDLGSTGTFYKIVLNAINSANDYPRGFQVYVSNDGVNWGGSIATGTGSAGVTTITFGTQAARYIRIIQTGSTAGTFWSIDEFNVFGAAPAAPAGLTATPASASQVNLSWSTSAGAAGYNVKRATVSGGAYVTVATNFTGLTYLDAGLTGGTTYYYVVTATNQFGESTSSLEASARTVSTNPPQLSLSAGAGQLQLSWPLDHLGWRLETQTNPVNAGLGNHWVTVPNSANTNQIYIPVNISNVSVFFRLTYP